MNQTLQRLLTLAVIVLCWQLTGCSSHRNPFERPRSGAAERGLASWYGKPFHGRATSSGEIYDMHGLTAAHRELPLGTVALVTNLENGRSVQVKINDRGPFVRGRIVDLSYAAARELDMVAAGLAKVELRVLAVGGGNSGPLWTAGYSVQAGAFKDRDNALDLQNRLRDRFPEAEVRTEDGWHRVWIGRFKKKKDADKVRREVSHLGLPAILVSVS